MARESHTEEASPSAGTAARAEALEARQLLCAFGPHQNPTVAEAHAAAAMSSPAALTASVRVEVGNTASYTDTAGKVWSKDSGAVGGTVSTTAYAVGNTSDDKLYYTR